ncbi:MAG: DoxX family protein [Gammaproteobacteria bacterium]|nr:DoxX family protein [Gammaproteobacteria bacterium]
MSLMTKIFCPVARPAIRLLDFLQPVLDLGLRLWVAKVFFASGLTKVQSWETTVWLFEEEYMVPVLSPQIAAFMATSAELFLPVLLVLGLATRFGVAGLFILNAVAVLSYAETLGAVGIKDHILWGMMLLVTLIHGPGKLALDHFIWQKFETNEN